VCRRTTGPARRSAPCGDDQPGAPDGVSQPGVAQVEHAGRDELLGDPPDAGAGALGHRHQAFSALARVSMESNAKVRDIAELFVETGQLRPG
jgi:hypothetical protein